ncbi:MAG: polysaccharide deacetylase family protein [Thermoguttaceae bacterium]
MNEHQTVNGDPRCERLGGKFPHARPDHNARSSHLGNTPRRLAERFAVLLSHFFGNRSPGSFGILMYHRIAPHVPGHPLPTWNVTPEKFREQMCGLLAKGFRPWPLRKAVEYHLQGRPIPRNVFVLTFDDGYQCFYTNAWPILRELQMPATVFIVTGLLDAEGPLPFDDWSAAGSPLVPASAWRPMTKAQCRELSAFGLVELGLHTHEHEDFRNRPEALRRDLATSLKTLYKCFGIHEVTFAYPYGFAGEDLADEVRSAGIICALTCDSKLVNPTSDPFLWGRFSAYQSDTPATLAAKLSGWYDALRSLVYSRRIPRIIFS